MASNLTGKNRNMSYEVCLGIFEGSKLLRTLKSECLHLLRYEIYIY